MIHRFVDLLEESLEPNIVFLVREQPPTSQYSIWKAGNLATPVEFLTSTIAITSNDHLADPHLSADGDMVVYSRVGNNIAAPNRKTSIRTMTWADTNNTEVYAETGGELLSLQPVWNPDRTKILFRAKGAGTFPTLIKDMDADGSNVQTLFTGTVSGGNQVLTPIYNNDGTRIAFVENGALKVMDADGTNLASIHTAALGQPAWANTQNVIAFLEVSGTDRLFRKINDDGTGLTTLKNYVGAGATTTNNLIMFSWTSDDSALVIIERLGAETSYSIARLDTTTGTVTRYNPSRTTANTPDTRPVVFGSRVYFVDTTTTPYTKLASILATDGSDYRVDFDGDALGTPGATIFHGFRGDSLNV